MKFYHYMVLVGSLISFGLSISQGDYEVAFWVINCLAWCLLHAVKVGDPL